MKRYPVSGASDNGGLQEMRAVILVLTMMKLCSMFSTISGTRGTENSKPNIILSVSTNLIG